MWEHPKVSIHNREAYKVTLATYQQQGHPIVYVDESGFAVDMPRTHGYAPKGQRVVGKRNWHERGRINVLGALLAGSLLTACTVEGPVDAEVFKAWLEQDLIPQLPPNSVVVMDNAPFHRVPITEQILAAHGHTLLPLPTYSPDLNPIEHTWHEKKALRRRTQCSVENLFM
jgi:transposase